MNATDALTKETAETKKRIAKLTEETRHEQLRKEELDLKYEVATMTRLSVLGWIKRLFRRGGKERE